MKTKSINKFAAVFLALAVLLTLIPLSPFSGTKAMAADTESYVLDVNSLEAKSYTDDTTAGTDDYFTIKWGDKGKVDTSDKTFDDGYAGKNRLNFGGKTEVAKGTRVVEFKTNGAAKVKIWWVAGDAKRQMQVYNATKGENADATSVDVAKNAMVISELNVAEAATYWITAADGTNYVFKIEVIPQVAEKNYDLDVNSLEAKSYTDDTTAGTDDYFTIKWGDKGKVDTSDKTFDDGYAGKNRLNFGGKTEVAKGTRVVEFKTNGAAKVKIWWVAGDAKRQMQVYNATKGENADATSVDVAKNAMVISELNVTEAATYWITAADGTNYIFKVTVTEGGSSAPVIRGDWNSVADPIITNVEQSGSKINVTVSAVVGNDGGDEVVVKMLDGNDEVVESKRSIAAKSEHTLEFAPTKSGTYTFKATLSRENETDKICDPVTLDYVLPLGKPVISSATSKGNGTMEIVWNPVDEATGYTVYNGDTAVTTVSGGNTLTYTVTGLTVGQNYTFTVAAVRGEETGAKSDPITATATQESRATWGFTYYGTSTSAKNNTYSGGVNDPSGEVTVTAENNGGKLESGASDGISFYYTSVPSDKNFVLRAKMHLDTWHYTNGQEAIGLLASDSIPAIGTIPYWTNNYYLTLGTVTYRWDRENNVVDYTNDTEFRRYVMRFGLGVYPNLGVTKENQATMGTNGLAGVVDPNIQYPLELSAAQQNLPAGNYNIAAGVDNPDALANASISSIAELTTFDLEIRKNNTGYFFTYYDENGNEIGKQKFYDTEALSHVDEDNVYVGFFAARNATATFSDVEFTIINPEDDDPREETPITYVTPRLDIVSANVSNSNEYTLMMNANVAGEAVVYVNNKSVATIDMPANQIVSEIISFTMSENEVLVKFTPYPEQDLGEYREFASTDTVFSSIDVTFNNRFSSLDTIYVSGSGNSRGSGTRDNPLDIYTAVNVVQPGQTIVIMEGTYNLSSTVRVQRGIDGTASAPIRMIADPEASSRPVFDFSGACEGFRFGGSFWYVSGFDVTNSANGTTGIRVCGNNNTLDQINAYNNGNTGIQISAYRDSSDPKELWPSNNLILNCTSYNNADAGYEDADGFAAKITCGDGNVFDGCVSYHNADDGWDLFARASSGNIGSVTIRNCVAYGNGIMLDGTNAGNGNGFKLGGGNLAGGHRLINSYAFNNKADGITSNSCPDVKITNCTSYNNGGRNLNLYTNGGGATAFTVEGLVSCGGTGDRIQTTAGNDSSVINAATNVTVTADAFVSTEFNGVGRKADGTIDLGDFLKLNENAPAGATGADLDRENGSTPSNPGNTGTPGADPSNPITPSTPSTPSDPSSPSTPSTPSTPSDNNSVEFEDNDTDIEVTAPAGAFDNADDIKFKADPVLGETNDNTFTFDLSFTDGSGNKVQPKIAVTVRIPVPAALVGKTIYVYHVENDGSYTEIDCKVEDGMVVFTASSFSKYIITSEKLNSSDNSGDNGNNSETPSTPTSPETPNPSTGASLPAVGMAIALASLAAVCIIKRKH